MYTKSIYCAHKLTMFLGMSPSEHQFYELGSSVAICVLCVILSFRMRPVVWSLPTYTVCKFLLCLEQVHQVNLHLWQHSVMWDWFLTCLLFRNAQFSTGIVIVTEDW